MFKNCFILLFILFCIDAKAAWKAEKYLPSSSILEDYSFRYLQSELIDYLEDSWCSKEKVILLTELIAVERPEVCVEIGVFTGSSLLPIAATLKYLSNGLVYAIDSWDNKEAIRGLIDTDPNKGWWALVDLQNAYSLFETTLNLWDLFPYCQIMHENSISASSWIHEIDFLHIDGNASEEGSILDVQLYLPKVKSGGYILFSNLFLMVGNQPPRMNAFCELLDSCEVVCEIDHNNCVLLKKK